MKIPASLFISLVYFSSLQTAYAVDEKRGEELHNENCISCHASMYGEMGNEIYTRQNRKIDSLSALEEQLQRCKNSLGTNWPEDQLKDLQFYLNKNFYHFKE